MNRLTSLLRFNLFIVLLLQFTAFSQDHEQWSYDLSIYEVNVRQYTQQGTFAAFENHLDRLKDMGAGILWFMPVHPIGVQNRLGSLGSYYSVKDYYSVNPEFGTLEEFKTLVEKIHQKGMYVIIDWVANHTSWDNGLTLTNPEWYTKDQNGNFIPPPGTNWTDVIDLDYSQQGLREYMINAMKFWVTETGIDGFRCDAAGWVPMNFWSSAITELKNLKPDLFMLAEDEGPAYAAAGFDATFAWGYYGFGGGVLKNIVNGTYNAGHMDSYIQTQQISYPKKHSRMYFTSNHDENSWYGTEYELFGSAAENFAVLSASVNGIPLIYSGQEAGLNKRLKFFDKDLINWQQHPNYELYLKLLHLKKENMALWNGTRGGDTYRVNTSQNSSVYSFLRQKENDRIFAVFNLSGQPKNIILQDTVYIDNFINVFNSDTVSFSSGSQINLAAWEYRLYKKGGLTSITSNEMEPAKAFYLSQNYPNPFNPSTTITFYLPASSHVSLSIYDILGNEAAILADEQMAAGQHSIVFDASLLVSGVYFCRITAGSHTETKKLMLIK